MILPKLSAAILAMSFYGSAYAAYDAYEPERKASLAEWVVISGATNGAANVLGASPEDLTAHRSTAQSHLMRYATEQGVPLDEFDSLFERGMIEGRKLVADRSHILAPQHDQLINGFQHDKTIAYKNVKEALDA